MIDNHILNWLLEENNPGVRLRTLTGLCGLPDSDEQVIAARHLAVQTVEGPRDLSWMDQKGLALIYGLTALAESGLTRREVPVDALVERLLTQPFDAGCGDMILLRALVMLGYADDPRLEQRFAQMAATQLPDGGWLCLHRVNKMKKTPKSCIKAAMHGLLLAGEMKKRGLQFSGQAALVEYFLKRRLFYRTDDPAQLVLNYRPGWRMVDVFFPIEVQRAGLPVLLEALAALGAGQAPELHLAWDFLDEKKDPQGRIILEGTLVKSYLAKERVGKPSKWATLYAYQAWQARY